MAYTITTSSGSTITVQDTTVDTTYALKLIGRNVSGYGQYFVENTIRQLENFASTVQPSGIKLEGQIWYDKSEKILKVWTGSNWNRATNIVVGTSEPLNAVAGDAWYRTNNKKLYINDGAGFNLSGYAGEITDAYKNDAAVGNPSNYGSKLRNIFLTDSTGKAKPVLALTMVNDGTLNAGATVTPDGKETIMAIFNDHAQFTAKNDNSITEGSQVNYYNELTSSGGIGITIKPGLNLRGEYADTAVALSERAYRADVAYKLNLGDPGKHAGNVNVNTLARTEVDFIPAADGGIQLGNDQYHFAGLYTNFIRLGKGGLANLEVNGTVIIGNSTNRVSKIWSQDLDVSGNITFGSGIQNIGESGTPVENFYTANAVVTSTFTVGTGSGAYTLPSTDGTINQALTTDGSGVLSFSNVPLSTTEMIAGAGLTGGGTLASSRTFDIGAGQYINVAVDSISVDGTVSADAGKVAVRTGSGGLNSTSLDAGSGTIETTGTVTGGTITDGSATLVSGALSGATTGGFSGTVTAGSFTDGALNINSGHITSGASATFSGNVDAANFNGVASSAKYADLAEIYSADADYEAGTIVKIGGDAEITQTTEHADVNVFGVISTDPAYLMNSDANGLPVALQGRVPVKVVGKIKKGDRLISSDEPGMAWAYLDSDSYDVRAVIGRSLQDKEDGGLGFVEAVIGIK